MKDKIKKEFEALKKAIIERAAPHMEEPALKAVVSSLEEFERGLEGNLEDADTGSAQLKEENEILRSISGLSGDGIKAKTVEQGEEIRFLRGQLLKLKKEYDKLKQTGEELNVSLAKLKNQNAKIQGLRDAEQKKGIDDMENLKTCLKELKEKVETQQTEIGKEKERIISEDKEFRERNSGEIENKMLQEIKLMSSKLRNLTSAISGSSKFCLEKLENIRSSSPKTAPKSLAQRIAGKLGKPAQDYVLELAPDLDLINRSSTELTQAIDIYIKLYEEPKVKYEKINFLDLWNELNGKYMTQIARFNIKIKWPAEMKYPAFSSDRKIISEICHTLIINALESMPQGGVLEIAAVFSDESIKLVFADEGAGIKTDDKGKLFLPFYSTKPGRWGMGLPTAQRCSAVLGGEITYEPKNKGSVFTLMLPRDGEKK
ncbi:MAG: ATP-binding protein [Elusimicrobiota bacterium]